MATRQWVGPFVGRKLRQEKLVAYTAPHVFLRFKQRFVGGFLLFGQQLLFFFQPFGLFAFGLLFLFGSLFGISFPLFAG